MQRMGRSVCAWVYRKDKAGPPGNTEAVYFHIAKALRPESQPDRLAGEPMNTVQFDTGPELAVRSAYRIYGIVAGAFLPFNAVHAARESI
jgi:hypothetical protein